MEFILTWKVHLGLDVNSFLIMRELCCEGLYKVAVDVSLICSLKNRTETIKNNTYTLNLLLDRVRRSNTMQYINHIAGT